MVYLLASTAFCIGGLIIVYWIHNQYHLDIIVEPDSPPPNPPVISVCVPARNEERNIRTCVEAILDQDYPNFEAIILDDCSMDSTLGILQHLAVGNHKLNIIGGSDLPDGWAGKPHALYQASACAHGDWLCFVDADTILSPTALSSCYSKALETKADMFSIMTFQVLGSFWEKTVLPLVITALSVGFPPRKVNDPGTKNAIANGQFIMIRRPVYDAIGGHGSVRDSIVEDKAISEQVKWSGYRLIVANGMKVAKTRMYTSLHEMWEGWTKNIYIGLRDQPSLMILGIFGVTLAVLACLFLPIWPILGLAWFIKEGEWAAVVVVVESLLLWIYLLRSRAAVALNMRISPWYALTTPLGAGVFGAMMFTSAWKVISGTGVSWRGRIYTKH